MRIAWFTPFNARSTIGHYSEAITRELAGKDQVVLYASDVGPKTAPRPTRLPLVPLADGPSPALVRELGDFDAVVYNMGNYPTYHKRIYEVLIRRPGVVILHDLVYRGFLQAYIGQEKGDQRELAHCVAYSEGRAAVEANRALLEGRPDQDAATPLRFPLFKALLARCRGVIVHSEYSRARVAPAVSAPVVKLDFPPLGPCATRTTAPASSRGRGKVRLLTFGCLNANKCIHTVIETIAQSDHLRANVEYTVVGEGDGDYPHRLQRLVESHGLAGVVHLTGWLSDDELWTRVTQADLVINLRNPHLGESSSALLNALLAGSAVVVWNHGWYAEFPDDVVCKVSSNAELADALERLCRDDGLRARLAAAARRHARACFNTAAYCRGFRSFMDVVLRHKPILGLIDAASDLLLEFGSRPPTGIVERLAAEVAVMAKAQPEAA
jgi:glycosyltransferase involved in cell wall biosynthesis